VVKVAMVIPTVRKFIGWNTFKESIDQSGYDVDVYTCGEKKDVNPQIDKVIYSSPTWRQKEFGKKNLWLFPPFTRHVNSIYAYILKEHLKYDMIVTVDDDLECDFLFLERHWEALNQKVWTDYENVVDDNFYPRGFPYKYRHGGNSVVMFNQGLWDNISDMNAHDYAINPWVFPKKGYNIAQIGKGITVSSMNVAFRPDCLKLYYQPVEWTRHDDIWSGLILKRILDAKKLFMGYGYPIATHNKFPRNIWNDNKLEANGHEINEVMWDELQKIRLTGSMFDMYRQITEQLPFPDLTRSMKGWIRLVERF
jgi:hypothetical protein